MLSKRIFYIVGSVCLLSLCIASFSMSYTITYQYDALNRLTQVEYSNGTVIAYTYDDAGNRLSQIVQAVLHNYTLTVEKSGAGSGAIQGSGIDCGADCLEVYEEGTLIFLKAIADSDSIFEQWLVDGEPAQGKIEMLNDITVTAVFQKQ